MGTEFKHFPPRGEVTLYTAEGQEVVRVGRHSYAHPSSHLYHYWFPPRLRIGNFTSIAAGGRFFFRQNHHPEWVTTYPVELFLSPEAGAGRHDDLPGAIIIGSDVWIGDSATILPGVTIGDGAVIGANAVIAKDVPPYAVVVGNPGRVIRYRFDESSIARLLSIRWWDWPIERIQEMAPMIWSSDISGFLKAVR